jgi:rod shape-determining protein MreC
MIKNRLLFLFVTGALFYISINFNPAIREKVLAFPLQIKSYIFHTYDEIKMQIDTFFDQKKKIIHLKKELQACQKTAALSVAFGSKLNHLLEEAGMRPYNPKLYLARTLSYVKLGDFGTMWLDFPEYDRSKIYGLLYKGYAAGIVDNKDGYPLARLLTNKKMVFSVIVGIEKHLGVVFGDERFLVVKYLPTYADIKPGDEVLTSGDDNIFYEGIKVGEVVDVKEYNLYKMALVQPYVKLHKPDFFFVVDATQFDMNGTISPDFAK